MTNVVITGMGVISSIGQNIPEFWKACLNAEAIIESIPKSWSSYANYSSGVWSPLPYFDFSSMGFIRNEIMTRDPTSLIAILASEQALRQAGLKTILHERRSNQFVLPEVNSEKFGVYIGTGQGGTDSWQKSLRSQMLIIPKKQLEAIIEDTEENQKILDLLISRPRFSPFSVSMAMPNAISASVGMKYSLHGTNRTVAQACSSGTSAIGTAFHAIRSGVIDHALCGASEYLNDAFGGIYRGFDIARTLVRPKNKPLSANRPFDIDRSGFLFSQGGAGMLVLERESVARQRGANILAKVVGYGETFDAYSMMSKASDGIQIQRMLHQALEDANLQTSDIDYINAHGTGTQTNDIIEAECIQAVFGKQPLINSTKSILGHTIAASGAIEAIVSTLSLQEQTTHISKNLENPIADLNFVQSVSPQKINYALSESFAFGGHNSCLIFQRYE